MASLPWCLVLEGLRDRVVEAVVPVAADEAIAAVPAAQLVVALVAEQLVIAGSARHLGVRARAALDVVASVVALQHVVPGSAGDLVDAVASADRLRSRSAMEMVASASAQRLDRGLARR